MRPTPLDTELNSSVVLRLILSLEEFGEIDGSTLTTWSSKKKLKNKQQQTRERTTQTGRAHIIMTWQTLIPP